MTDHCHFCRSVDPWSDRRWAAEAGTQFTALHVLTPDADARAGHVGAGDARPPGPEGQLPTTRRRCPVWPGVDVTAGSGARWPEPRAAAGQIIALMRAAMSASCCW